MKITLIRHTSVDVAPGICYGRTDVALKNTFPEEAEKVKDKIEGKTFDAVFTSPLSRCRRLAYYCGYGQAVADERLLEMNFGDWEMKRYDEIDDPRLQLWFDDYLNLAPTGGESAMQQKERFVDFINEIKSKGYENVLVFTHAGILFHAMHLYKGMPYAEAISSAPQYGEVMEIDL